MGTQQTTGPASAAWAFALAALGAILLGALGARAGALAPFTGFRLFALGLVAGPLALALAGFARWRSRSPRARAALFLAGAETALLIALAAPGLAVPPIHDISTDTEDPPRFVALAADPSFAGQDLAYPGGEVARLQREAYPDLLPLEVAIPPEQALTRAEAAARALGWRVRALDRAAGRLEASDTSRFFRFVDDVVVRVRATPRGSRIDVRSRSRVGRSDLGANASRIRRFFARFAAVGG